MVFTWELPYHLESLNSRAIGLEAERNEIQLAKSELDLKATHNDPRCLYKDLHITVNSESIAIKRKFFGPFPAIIDRWMISQNSVERRKKQEEKDRKEIFNHVLELMQ